MSSGRGQLALDRSRQAFAALARRGEKGFAVIAQDLGEDGLFGLAV